MFNLLKFLLIIGLFSFILSNTIDAAEKTETNNYLTKKEQAQIAEYLNNICADTFCGGDYHYENIGVFCENNCVVYYDISPQLKTDYFSPYQFTNAPSELKSFEDSKVSLRIYKARNFRDHFYGVNGELIYFTNIKLTVKCELKALLNDNQLSFEDKKEDIYINQLKCVESASLNMHMIQQSL